MEVSASLPPATIGWLSNYGPFLGTLNIRFRIITSTQKGTLILTTTHLGLIPSSHQRASECQSTCMLEAPTSICFWARLATKTTLRIPSPRRLNLNDGHFMNTLHSVTSSPPDFGVGVFLAKPTTRPSSRIAPASSKHLTAQVVRAAREIVA